MLMLDTSQSSSRACPFRQLLWCSCAGGFIQDVIKVLIKLQLHDKSHRDIAVVSASSHNSCTALGRPN